MSELVEAKRAYLLKRHPGLFRRIREACCDESPVDPDYHAVRICEDVLDAAYPRGRRGSRVPFGHLARERLLRARKQGGEPGRLDSPPLAVSPEKGYALHADEEESSLTDITAADTASSRRHRLRPPPPQQSRRRGTAETRAKRDTLPDEASCATRVAGGRDER